MDAPPKVQASGSPTPDGPRRDDPVRIREAAEAFEALLLQQMVRTMRKAQVQDGLFGETAGADVYEAWFDEFLARRLAEDSRWGIAEMLEARWLGGEGRFERDQEALRRLREAGTAGGVVEAQVAVPAADKRVGTIEPEEGNP